MESLKKFVIYETTPLASTAVKYVQAKDITEIYRRYLYKLLDQRNDCFSEYLDEIFGESYQEDIEDILGETDIWHDAGTGSLELKLKYLKEIFDKASPEVVEKIFLFYFTVDYGYQEDWDCRDFLEIKEWEEPVFENWFINRLNSCEN